MPPLHSPPMDKSTAKQKRYDEDKDRPQQTITGVNLTPFEVINKRNSHQLLSSGIYFKNVLVDKQNSF